MSSCTFLSSVVVSYVGMEAWMLLYGVLDGFVVHERILMKKLQG